MTPLALEMLLHFRSSPEPFEDIQRNPQQEIVEAFMKNDIIRSGSDSESIYIVTPKGNAFLEMILSTPYPEASFINPLTSKKIEVE